MLDYSDISVRYQQLRKVSFGLNNKLVKTLTKEILHEGGRKLGILKNDTLVFDSEDETSILMDYCIYNVRSQGRNAVERYLDQTPPPDSEETAILQILLQGWYSLFQVQSNCVNVGVHVLDVFRQCFVFMADVGFSRTAQPGSVLATRVFPCGDFVFAGGAALPMDGKTMDRVRDQLKRFIFSKNIKDLANMSPEEDADFAALMIRACRNEKMTSFINYGDIEENRTIQLSTREVAPAAPKGVQTAPVLTRLGRNDPCHCGSGNKFKKCCGRFQ